MFGRKSKPDPAKSGALVVEDKGKKESKASKAAAATKRKKDPKVAPAEEVQHLQAAKKDADDAAALSKKGEVDTKKEPQKELPEGKGKKDDKAAKKEHHKHHHKHKHKSEKESGPVQGPETQKAAENKINSAIATRKAAYKAHSEKLDEIEKSDAKHAYTNELINLGGKMNETDATLDSFSEGERKVIINASGSASIRERFKAVMDVVADKKAAVNNVVTDVKENPMVYTMIEHVGEVTDTDKSNAKKAATRELRYKNRAAVLAKEAELDKQGASKSKKRSEIRDLKKQQQADFESQVEDEMYARINTPSKAYEADQAEEEDLETQKGIFEFILEFYNGIVGACGDYPEMLDSLDGFKEVSDDFGKWEIGDLEAGGATPFAMVGALLNGMKVITDIIIDAVDAKNAKGKMDSQEKWQRTRGVISNVVELINSVIDFVSPFTSMVPLLGTVLSLCQNAGSIAVNIIELRDNHKHRKQINNAKDILKERLEAKKEKYKDNPDEVELFSIKKYDDDSIRAKRTELMAKVATHMGLSKDEDEIKDNEYVAHHWWTKLMSKVDKVHKSARSNYASGYGAVNERLAAHMEEKRKQYHEGKVTDKAAYKKEMHAMEALELFNEYEVQNAAAHRMNVKSGSDAKDLVMNSLKLGANVTSLIGEILTATGVGGIAGGSMVAVSKIIKAGLGTVELLNGVGSQINSQFEAHSQRGKNKEYVRHEMGVALCERMESLSHLLAGNAGWLKGGEDAGTNVKDYTVKQIGRDFGYIRSVRQGTDMKVSSVISAGSRVEIIDSLSKAFSQDGN